MENQYYDNRAVSDFGPVSARKRMHHPNDRSQRGAAGRSLIVHDLLRDAVRVQKQEGRFTHCDVCGKLTPDGPRRYGLRRIALYDIRVCVPCQHENADGWLRKHEDKVLEKLNARQAVLPRRQRNGLLPFE